MKAKLLLCISCATLISSAAFANDKDRHDKSYSSGYATSDYSRSTSSASGTWDRNTVPDNRGTQGTGTGTGTGTTGTGTATGTGTTGTSSGSTSSRGGLSN